MCVAQAFLPVWARAPVAYIRARAVLGHEAETHLPALVVKRGGNPETALRFLRSLRGLVELIGSEVYGDLESDARERSGERDPDDWPVLASALAIGCPIWTEDTDFFGCGVLTWTTSRVAMFLRDPQK
jgi:predicted nucleic acid-binding protein